MNQRGKPTALTGAWLALVQHAGGVRELADALHVDRTTLTRGGTGKRRPSAAVVEAVNGWARRRQLAEPWA